MEGRKEGGTDGHNLFYRTPPATAGGPMKPADLMSSTYIGFNKKTVLWTYIVSDLKDE